MVLKHYLKVFEDQKSECYAVLGDFGHKVGNRKELHRCQVIVKAEVYLKSFSSVDS